MLLPCGEIRLNGAIFGHCLYLPRSQRPHNADRRELLSPAASTPVTQPRLFSKYTGVRRTIVERCQKRTKSWYTCVLHVFQTQGKTPVSVVNVRMAELHGYGGQSRPILPPCGAFFYLTSKLHTDPPPKKRLLLYFTDFILLT